MLRKNLSLQMFLLILDYQEFDKNMDHNRKLFHQNFLYLCEVFNSDPDGNDQTNCCEEKTSFNIQMYRKR